jgi:hypothetical protein
MAQHPAMASHDDEIPDATQSPTDQSMEAPELRLGDPFAISFEADLVETKEGGGCTAILQCDCGQRFRIDLLAAGVKYCPKCRAGFTHALLVCAVDNTEIVAAAMQQVLVANGLRQPDEGDDDDDENGEGDDDEADDDGEGDGEGDDGQGDDEQRG